MRPCPCPRPTRRTLHRQARVLPLHLAHQRMAEAIERITRPDVDVAALCALLDRVWQRGGGSAWSLADLRELRLLPHGADANRIGQVLGKLADGHEAIGRWRVVRVDTGAKKLRDGRLWRLVPRW